MRLLIEGDFEDLGDMVEALKDHRLVKVTLVTDVPLYGLHDESEEEPKPTYHSECGRTLERL